MTSILESHFITLTIEILYARPVCNRSTRDRLRIDTDKSLFALRPEVKPEVGSLRLKEKVDLRLNCFLTLALNNNKSQYTLSFRCDY